MQAREPSNDNTKVGAESAENEITPTLTDTTEAAPTGKDLRETLKEKRLAKLANVDSNPPQQGAHRLFSAAAAGLIPKFLQNDAAFQNANKQGLEKIPSAGDGTGTQNLESDVPNSTAMEE